MRTPRQVLANGLQAAVASMTLALAMTSAGLAQQQQEQPKQDTGVQKTTVMQQAKPVYDEKADAKKQIADALAVAKRENQRVLIQWGGNWCTWCIALHHLYETDRAVSNKLMYEYQVVYVDIGKSDKNMDLAKAYGADLQKSGVPFLTVLDAEGKALANQETESLEATAVEGQEKKVAHDPKKVMDFLTKNQAAYWKAEDVYAKGLAEANSSGRTAFVHFGAPWCPWCHVLEDWMNKPETAALLAKDFVDVKIDVDRMTGGKELLTRMGGKEDDGIPWFVFVSADGKVMSTSTGPKGNTGCPASADEVAHFKEMLMNAAKKLTPAEIETLTTTVAEAAKKAAGH